jgi:diacylglycerol kinase (ATP)
MKTPTRLILNPAAAGGSARRLRSELLRKLSPFLDLELRETEDRWHAVELAGEAARNGARLVLAAGGDGTIHEVANGLLAARGREPTVPLGVVPIGTGNDFAKMLYRTPSRRAAYAALAATSLRRFDVGRASWDGGSEYFINAMGTGIDVEVVRQIERLPHLPGVLGYLAGVVRAVFGFRALPMRIRIDGTDRQKPLMIAAIGVGHCLGGGFYVFPGARPDDGLFDICTVDEIGLARIARVLPRVMRGRHVGMREVTMDTGTAIDIEILGEQPLFFQLDGELREPPAARRLHVELIPSVLNVIAGDA